MENIHKIFKAGSAENWLGNCEKCGESVFRYQPRAKRVFGGVAYYSHAECRNKKKTARNKSAVAENS